MPGPTGRDPDDDAADQQEQTAAELSGRAADSVDRRYDATKETHIDDRARAGAAENGASADERRKSGRKSGRD